MWTSMQLVDYEDYLDPDSNILFAGIECYQMSQL